MKKYVDNVFSKKLQINGSIPTLNMVNGNANVWFGNGYDQTEYVQAKIVNRKTFVLRTGVSVSVMYAVYNGTIINWWWTDYTSVIRFYKS